MYFIVEDKSLSSLQWIQVISEAATPNYSVLKSLKKVPIENSDLQFALRMKTDTNSHFPGILGDKWVVEVHAFLHYSAATAHLNNNHGHKSHRSII